MAEPTPDSDRGLGAPGPALAGAANPDAPRTDEPASKVEQVTGLWARIKEHKILQWGLGYLAVAFALSQGAGLVADTFDWPTIVPRLVMILLALGLPVVLTLAWYHGHKGLQRFSAAEMSILAVLLMIGAGLLFAFVRPSDDSRGGAETRSSAETAPASAASDQASSAPSAAPRESLSAPASGKPRIAVMPFENLSPDPANAFFTDGMHEEVLTALANGAPGLEVISRTTMDSYKGKQVTAGELVKELGCTHVLEGSVRREGEDVRVTFQLINARTDEHLWAQNYDRKLVKVMTLQSEVAGEVAGQLKVKLAGGASAEPKVPTTDPVAYDLFLKARLARRDLTNASPLEAWRAAESLYAQVIARDPKFVAAYVGRIEIEWFLFGLNYDPSEAPLKLMKADLEAVRALAPRDPSVLAAEAIWAFADQDFARALEYFETAEAGGLTDPDLLFWHSTLLLTRGELDAAIDNLKPRILLDPGNQSLAAIYGSTLMTAGRAQEAMAFAKAGQARWPDSFFWPLMRSTIFAAFAGDDAPAQQGCEALAESPNQSDIDTDFGLSVQMACARSAADFKARLDNVTAESLRNTTILFRPPLGLGRFPLAQVRGRASFLAGDRVAAARNGDAVLAFAKRQTATKWNRWYLRMLEGSGLALKGDRAGAGKAAHEALALVAPADNRAGMLIAQSFAVEVFALAGDSDEAVRLLERLSDSGAIPPGSIVRPGRFSARLADNPRYQALKAKLEAQMAATKLE